MGCVFVQFMILFQYRNYNRFHYKLYCNYCQSLYTSKNEGIRIFLTKNETGCKGDFMRYPMITGHAGNDNTGMNSLDSLYKSVSLGADAIEVDVRSDMRSVLVLSHDAQNQDVYVICLKLSDLFETASQYPEIRINCDLKEKDLPLAVISLARQYGLDAERLILTGTVPPSYISIHPEIINMSHVYLNIEFALEEICLNEMKKSNIEIQDYYVKPWKYIRELVPYTEQNIRKAAQVCNDCKVKGINVPYSLLSDQNIRIFKESGIPVSVWTVNDENEMIRLFQAGIENLTTRNVAKAKTIRMSLFNF